MAERYGSRPEAHVAQNWRNKKYNITGIKFDNCDHYNIQDRPKCPTCQQVKVPITSLFSK